MQKEQDSGYDSYLKHTDSLQSQSRVKCQLPALLQLKIKKNQREKLLNCIKGLHPAIRLTVVFCFSLNSWLLVFILCSPLYFKP